MDSATVMAVFAGEHRGLRLGLGEWELLQAKHDIGPFFLEALFRAMRATPAHIQDIIKFGLIGGGMEEAEAVRLVEITVVAGRLTRYYQLAHEVLVAFVGPADEEDNPSKKPTPPAEADTKSASEASSP